MAIDTIDRAGWATIGSCGQAPGGHDACYSIRHDTGFSFCFISLRFAPAARTPLTIRHRGAVTPEEFPE